VGDLALARLVPAMKRVLLGLAWIAAAATAMGRAAGFRVGMQDLTPTGGRSPGVVASDRSEAGTYFFRYRRLSAGGYESATPARAVQFVARQGKRVEEPISGLRPATAYIFTVWADDQERLGPFCARDTSWRRRGPRDATRPSPPAWPRPA
jgi:hypothetical protein